MMLKITTIFLVLFGHYSNAAVLHQLGLNHGTTLTQSQLIPSLLHIHQLQLPIHQIENLSQGAGTGQSSSSSSSLSEDDFDNHPQYNFAYDVKDLNTGDDKQQEENRDGEIVNGQYSLVEPDGTRRIVKYSSDPIKGFKAIVSKTPATDSELAAIQTRMQLNRERDQQQQQQQQQSRDQEQHDREVERQRNEQQQRENQQRANQQRENQQRENQQREQERQLTAALEVAEQQRLQQQQQQLQQKQQQEQIQLLQSRVRQNQDSISNAQALILAQSLPSKVLGQNVHSTISSHSPIILSKPPTTTVFTHANHVRTLENLRPTIIEHSAHPAVNAFFQTHLVHTPFLLQSLQNGGGVGLSIVERRQQNGEQNDNNNNNNNNGGGQNSMEINGNGNGGGGGGGSLRSRIIKNGW